MRDRIIDRTVHGFVFVCNGDGEFQRTVRVETRNKAGRSKAKSALERGELKNKSRTATACAGKETMTPRSKVIEKSLSCFDFGIASLIPLVGVFLTPFAFSNFKVAIVETNDRWNPARRHLCAGAALAVFSLLAHAIIATIIFVQMVRAFENA